MWPTWLLQAFEFTIPALESSRTVEAILHRGREGGWASASIASSLGNSDADEVEGGKAGHVSQAACVAGVLESSDGSRGQAGDGNG